MPYFENMTLLLEDEAFTDADAVEPATDAKRMQPDRVHVEALLKGRTAAIRAALRSSLPKVIHLVCPARNGPRRSARRSSSLTRYCER